MEYSKVRKKLNPHDDMIYSAGCQENQTAVNHMAQWIVKILRAKTIVRFH